jgi:hypothetical protein
MMFLTVVAIALAAECEISPESVSLLTLKTEIQQHAVSRAAVAAWSTLTHLQKMSAVVEQHQREQQAWAAEHNASKNEVQAMTVNSRGAATRSGCANFCAFIPEGSRCVVADCKDCDVCAASAPTTTTAAPKTTIDVWSSTPEGGLEVMGADHMDAYHEDLNAQNADTNTSHGEWIEHLRNAPKHEHLTERDAQIKAFVQKQKQSSDRCSAKTLEAKRTLDGIASKVMLLSDEIEAQEAIHEGGASTIKDMLDNGKKSKALLDDENQHCNDAYDACWDNLDTHRLEIVELHQMANPELRSVISHGGLDHQVDYAESSKQYALEVVDHYLKLYKTADLSHLEEAYKKNMSSFLQTQSCGEVAKSAKTAVALVSASKIKTRATPDWILALGCDEQREQLQVVYSDAFVDILKVLTQEENLCEDEKSQCAGKATGEDENKQADYQSLIAESTRNIQSAKDVIATILPLLDNAKKEFDILTAHIKELEESCEMDHDVTEHMEKIRHLIKTLEKCPGRNDFTITLPDVADITG